MLGSTMGEYSVSGLPQRNNNGHDLTVTVMPSSPDGPTQVFNRAFRTGKIIVFTLRVDHVSSFNY